MAVDTPTEPNPGLEGVLLADTRLSGVDGERGELVIAGYPVEELAPKATFEDVVHLLWEGRVPSDTERETLRASLAAARELPGEIIDLLRRAASVRRSPMDALRAASGALGLGSTATSAPWSDEEAVLALGSAPAIVANYARLLAGDEPASAPADLSFAASFLAILDGQTPDAARVRALETYLNTVVDHGCNASTFTSRVIASTDSDLISAVTGAIGALKGPLHGGAPGPALETVFEIGTADRAEAVLRAKLEAGERLMGFGHRVYKVRDPRAQVLSEACRELATHGGSDPGIFELAAHVEETAIRLLEEFKPGRRLQTNVEFYTALLLHGVGLESDFFTPVFAMSRIAGWIAHGREQRAEGRLIRPRLRYRGPKDLRFER